jgi:hypothetical protein
MDLSLKTPQQLHQAISKSLRVYVGLVKAGVVEVLDRHRQLISGNIFFQYRGHLVLLVLFLRKYREMVLRIQQYILNQQQEE